MKRYTLIAINSQVTNVYKFVTVISSPTQDINIFSDKTFYITKIENKYDSFITLVIRIFTRQEIGTAIRIIKRYHMNTFIIQMCRKIYVIGHIGGQKG